jgi:hypothetical protein
MIRSTRRATKGGFVAEHLMNLAPATISSYDRSSFSFLPSGRRQGSICCPQLLAAGTVAHLEDGAADLDQIPRRHLVLLMRIQLFPA